MTIKMFNGFSIIIYWSKDISVNGSLMGKKLGIKSLFLIPDLVFPFVTLGEKKSAYHDKYFFLKYVK